DAQIGHIARTDLTVDHGPARLRVIGHAGILLRSPINARSCAAARDKRQGSAGTEARGIALVGVGRGIAAPSTLLYRKRALRPESEKLRRIPRPRGGVVTQRSANPFTPVQFRPWPPH